MLPEQKPCTDATHAVVGYNPDMKGGGVLHWAHSLEEASQAADAYRQHGYQQVKVYREGPRREEATDNIVWKAITGDD